MCASCLPTSRRRYRSIFFTSDASWDLSGNEIFEAGTIIGFFDQRAMANLRSS